MWQFAIAFTTSATLDWVWAKYTYAMVGRNAPLCAFWASAIILLGGINVLVYVSSPFAILASAAGAAFGTWLAVKYGPQEKHEGGI